PRNPVTLAAVEKPFFVTALLGCHSQVSSMNSQPKRPPTTLVALAASGRGGLEIGCPAALSRLRAKRHTQIGAGVGANRVQSSGAFGRCMAGSRSGASAQNPKQRELSS